MEEKYGTIERVFAHKCSEVFLDCGPFDLALFHWHASIAILRRDTARRDVPGDVVTLPVLQHEWGRWNIGKAIYREISQEKLLPVDVMPKAMGCCRDESFLLTARVVVTEDHERVRIVHA